ncbi:MAG: hypothetical protein ACON5B_13440 [Myxococcota bacterium]
MVRARIATRGGLLALLWGCGETVPPDDEGIDHADIEQLVSGLHQQWNVDEADDPDGSWDALAAIYEGALLTDRYLEHVRRSVRAEQTQTQVRILRTDLRTAEKLNGMWRVQWSVSSALAHQSHQHHRLHDVTADWTVVDTERGRRVISETYRGAQRRTGSPMLDRLGAGAPEADGFVDPLEALWAKP